jgi:hypothetical protein
MPASHHAPATPGYEVEFIPIERRLSTRRLADRDPRAATARPAGRPERREASRRGR